VGRNKSRSLSIPSLAEPIMRLMTNEQISEFPHCDVELAGIEWLPDCGLRLTVALPDRRTVWLECSWISQLRLNMDFGRNSGRAMTWDIDYLKQVTGWHICMDFPGIGSIEFDCQEIHLENIGGC
jgi:hypothetical protein